MTAHKSAAQITWRVLGATVRVAVFLVCLDFFLFLLFDLLPEAAVSQLGFLSFDPALLEARRHNLGVTGSWLSRFSQFWLHLVQGDMGLSLQGGYPIARLVLDRLPVTLSFMFASLVLVVCIPVPLASLVINPPRTARPFWVKGLAVALHVAFIPQLLMTLVLFGLWATFIGEWCFRMGVDKPGRWVMVLIATSAMPLAIAMLSAVHFAEEVACGRFVHTYLMLGMETSRIRRLLMRNIWIAIRPLTGRLLLACFTGLIFAELLFDLPGLGGLFVGALRQGDTNLIRVLVLGLGLLVLGCSEIERGGDR